MRKLLSALYFFTALVSIVLYPRIHGLQFVQYGLLLIMLILYFIITMHGIKLSKNECTLTFFTVTFWTCSIIGAIASNGASGILTAIVFLICFIVTLTSVKYGLNNQLLKGFFFCAVLSSIYMIVDAFQFYLVSREPLIWILVPVTRDPEVIGRPHPFLNLIGVFGIPLYRPCGLSPDPGCSVTAITLAYIIYKENMINMKKNRIYDILVFSAIIISISKTSIFALFMYFFIKKIPNYYLPIKNKKYNFLIIIGILELMGLFAIGLITPYTGNGNERHLKYFASLIYTPIANPINFFFGYGFTNTGLFFDKYVPWISDVGKFRLTGHVCESTLTNIFLYGGFFGSFFWVYLFYIIFKSNNPKYLMIIDIIIFLAFGYTISGAWLFFVLFSLCLKSLNTNKEYSLLK